MELLASLFDRLGRSRSPLAKRPWGEIESGLGINLPEDYKAWGEEYSSLSLGGSVLISNFSSAEEGHPAEVEGRLAALRTVMQRNGVYRIYDSNGNTIDPEIVVWDVYPVVPGLLGWGSIVGGFELTWLTVGDPDEWRIVVADDADCLHVFECGFVEFVNRLLQYDLGPQLNASSWLNLSGVQEMWGYKTVNIRGREYRSIDFRSILDLSQLALSGSGVDEFVKRLVPVGL